MIPYKRRALDPSKPVEVYRNLHRSHLTFRTMPRATRDDAPVYSIRQAGRVVAHARELALVNVTFVVQPAGRLRTILTGRKCVHAWARGTISILPVTDAWCAVKYDPRRSGAFTRRDTGAPILHARSATIGPLGVRVVP